jgi:hypothetical protein
MLASFNADPDDENYEAIPGIELGFGTQEFCEKVEDDGDYESNMGHWLNRVVGACCAYNTVCHEYGENFSLSPSRSRFLMYY